MRGRWRIAAVVLAVVALAGAAAAILVLTVGGGSCQHATTGPPTGAQSLTRHHFLEPECAPLKATRWQFPGPAHISSNRYELFAIHYSCATAGTWARRLLRLKIPVYRSGKQSR